MDKASNKAEEGHSGEKIVTGDGQIDFGQVLKKQREFNIAFKKVKEEKDKQSAGINNFERNIGLKLLTLNDDAESVEDFKSDPMKDVQVFKEKSQKTFYDYKRRHRDVMNNIRYREYNTMSRVAQSKPLKKTNTDSSNAYEKIDQRV